MAQPAQETWRSGLPRHRGRISQAPKQPHQTKFNTVQAQSISSCLQKASHLATLLLKVLQPVLDVKRKGPIQGPTHCEETCGRVQSQLQGRIGLQSEAEGGRLGGRLQQDLRSLLVREQNPAAGDGRTVRGKDTRRAGTATPAASPAGSPATYVIPVEGGRATEASLTPGVQLLASRASATSLAALFSEAKASQISEQSDSSSAQSCARTWN